MKQLNRLMMRNRKDRKGVMVIEIVIGVMLMLILLSFLLDVTMLFWKFTSVSQLNSTIARVGGIQGGYLSAAPPYYPGGNSAYTSIGELRSTIQETMNSAGIPEDKWSLAVGGSNVLGSGAASQTGRFDYMTPFSTQITFKYKWTLLSNFLPGQIEQTLTSKRPTMSEWKYDYNSWVGE